MDNTIECSLRMSKFGCKLRKTKISKVWQNNDEQKNSAPKILIQH